MTFDEKLDIIIQHLLNSDLVKPEHKLELLENKLPLSELLSVRERIERLEDHIAKARKDMEDITFNSVRMIAENKVDLLSTKPNEADQLLEARVVYLESEMDKIENSLLSLRRRMSP